MSRGWVLDNGRRLRIALGAALLSCLLPVLVAPAAADAAPDPDFSARGSVEQVYVTDLPAGATVKLLDRRGRKVDKREANELGGLLFRRVEPGKGYRVRQAGGGESGALRVLSARSAPPDTSVYDQEIPSEGYGYLETRDGTKLAIYVRPPDDVANLTGADVPALPPDAPRPVLIEYAGYGYANPAGPESGIAIIGNLMGFTVVNVNMRGTGCSGGAFDFFERLQSLDGYDVIETIARQPWAANGEVGMMGISYGGISQLFTAATRPPSLAAISPLSLLDQTQTTLYPGGILNTGFALEWAKQRVHDALPAGPDSGQEWAYKRIQEGDETCKANQAMHGEAVDLLAKIRRNDHYKQKVADPLSPATFVDKIEVPVFAACQWTDEQTGGHCPNLADRFTGTDRKWFTFTNGTHVDSLAPDTFNRWYDFLQLYVARQAPATNSALPRAAAPVLYQEAFGVSGMTLPPDPIQQEPTYAGALAAFEALDPVRILFENGAGRDPGQSYPTFEQSFESFPAPGTAGRSWFFDRGGELGERRPGKRSTDSFRWDADARPPTNFTGDTGAGEDGIWTATPPYEWSQNPPGTAASYLTDPLATDTTVLGAGAVRLRVRSTTRDVDLQATVSEVRADGKETFVQGGWVRASGRKLDRKKSTPLEPVLSLKKKHVRPMPRNRFVKVTIPLYYQGHAYREGSRIRVTISAPGGDQPIWAFAKTKPNKRGEVVIASSKRKPSKLTLPVVEGVEVPGGLPPCPSLRGQPCRDYEPYDNG